MTPQNDHARPQNSPVNFGTRQDWARLGARMEARRVDMGYRFRPDFIQDRARLLGAGPLPMQTVKEIETGRVKRPDSWTPYLLNRIAPWYETTADSMLAVVRGDADELARVPAGQAIAAGPGSAPMTDEARAAAAWPYAMRLWQDIAEYLQVHPGTRQEDIPGAALFGRGTWYAAAWEDPERRELFTFKDWVWQFADLQRRADARGAGRSRTDRSA